MLLTNGVLSAISDSQFEAEPNTIVSAIADGPLEIIAVNGELSAPSITAPTLGGNTLLYRFPPDGGTVSFIMPCATCALFNRSTKDIAFEVFGTEPA